VRNAKMLQAKAAKCEVVPDVSHHVFVVRSPSGSVYTVRAFPNGQWTCTCAWGLNHWRTDEPCSHILAARNWCEQSGMRALSFWADEESAQRQHRPVEKVGPELWATSRKN
jgi:hypothetical protein